ncbi:MAG: hypothetical protein FJ246_04175 [Nitrospira sp.]|nr:hypothetical protein [Nitrospira sp.]
MRIRRHRDGRGLGLGLSAALFWLVFASAQASAGAVEFYSWIDASGTMVMTDDASQVPSPARRSDVSVHRFTDRSSEAVRPSENKEPEKAPSPSSPVSVDPADPDMPKILLDAPAEAVKVQYLWVPLVKPVSLGAGSISGFWCHRAVASPGGAFKAYLMQNQGRISAGQAVVGGGAWRYGAEQGGGRQAVARSRLSGGQGKHYVEHDVSVVRDWSSYHLRNNNQAEFSPRSGHGHPNGRR